MSIASEGIPISSGVGRIRSGWLWVRLTVASLWYRGCVALLAPLNTALALLLRSRRYPNSVLHVSYLIHIPYHTTRILRRHGWRADYLAIGANPQWRDCDYAFLPGRIWTLAFREFSLLWRVVARYEIVHLHFMMTLTRTGWELPFLKLAGRKIVAHFRGCEIRDRERNMALHPKVNICQECDYNASACTSAWARMRRRLAARFADQVLVTTPDMLDFAPAAEHFPFFAPEIEPSGDCARRSPGAPIRIVHVTNHPGIEGTKHIVAAIERLRARGYAIEFTHLQNVSYEEVLNALRSADLSIGKMKMGYYANAQIESMALGVPTVTYVRPEFMTDDLERSGFIFCDLAELESTLEHYIRHPDALEAKRRVARESVLRLHDNDTLARRLTHVYQRAARRARARGEQGH